MFWIDVQTLNKWESLSLLAQQKLICCWTSIPVCTYPPYRPDGERWTLPVTPVEWSRVLALLKYTLFSCEIFPAVGYPPKNISNDLVTSNSSFGSLSSSAEGFHLIKALLPQLMLIIVYKPKSHMESQQWLNKTRVKCECKNQLATTWPNTTPGNLIEIPMCEHKPVHYQERGWHPESY